MKRMLTVFTLLFFFSVANAQQPAQKDAWKNTRDGNQSFKAGNFVQAEKHYREAVHSDTNKVVANYNLGNSLYRQRKYDDASRAYADGLNTKNADSLAKGYHNLGNALLQEKKYQESINAYKQSLKLNPKDENTRYNLAYAESKLKQNQPPP
ncbi:MAG TPA: tetratricopeptide repeat protein, partial [Bacteroidia bacterium]|nr:tetratricopeptide repeat protein [Bacteroidia bacterium]